LRVKYHNALQSHVFRFEKELTKEESETLYNELKNVDLNEITSIYTRTNLEFKKQEKPKVLPFPDVCSFEGTEKEREYWAKVGYDLIAQGKVALLLLAGGQGTRLGSRNPKGMYDVGLGSGKSLYCMQAERLLKIQQLSAQKTGKFSEIPWYIMTSEATKDLSEKYFQEHNYFGLNSKNIFFFEQKSIPCVTPDGKIIMESKFQVARSPNGNGGLYLALKESGALADMKKRGVEYVNQYCVDNLLVKVVDPIFVGYCNIRKADCGVKVVGKESPDEPVGVLCLKNGKAGVVEYSEIDKETSTKMNSITGKLEYNAAHVCMNLFHFEFLKRAAEIQLPYHVAKKKIPAVNEKGETETPSEINGWKMEMFIFDIFESSSNLVALEVLRNEEFSPLKNAPGSQKDCPETCRRDLSNLHKAWIKKAGGQIIEGNDEDDFLICEISPLVSLDGEGLENIVKGKTFNLPLELN